MLRYEGSGMKACEAPCQVNYVPFISQAVMAASIIDIPQII